MRSLLLTKLRKIPMNYSIVIPLNSKNVLLEFDTKVPLKEVTTPANYGWLARNARGPIKVTLYRLTTPDPLHVSFEKLSATAQEWQQALQENRFLLAHTRGSIAQFDTAIAAKELEMEALKKPSPQEEKDYLESKSLITYLKQLQESVQENHSVAAAIREDALQKSSALIAKSEEHLESYKQETLQTATIEKELKLQLSRFNSCREHLEQRENIHEALAILELKAAHQKDTVAFQLPS